MLKRHLVQSHTKGSHQPSDQGAKDHGAPSLRIDPHKFMISIKGSPMKVDTILFQGNL